MCWILSSPVCRHNGVYEHTEGLMEQVLMDKMLGFLKQREDDRKPFFTYYAPFSVHKRYEERTQSKRTLTAARVIHLCNRMTAAAVPRAACGSCCACLSPAALVRRCPMEASPWTCTQNLLCVTASMPGRHPQPA